MKGTELITKARGTMYRAGFQLKKHSPAIMVITGTIGVVVGTVMACKATVKATKAVEDTKKSLDVIHESNVNGVTPAGEEYSEEDYKKDLVTAYAKGAGNLIKLYAPALLIEALSISLIIQSHRVMAKRNLALAAAYASTDKRFKEYRKRVLERFGEDVDKELRYDIKAKTIEETVTDENGEQKTVQKTVKTVGPLGRSDFASFFDERSRYWEKNGDYNLMFLRAQQQRANDILRSRGYLFLNEVYRMLDIPETIAGQNVGWVYDDTGKATDGDNYVDFGIMEVDWDAQEHPEEEPERTVLLDFNVDGPILNDFIYYDRTH